MLVFPFHINLYRLLCAGMVTRLLIIQIGVSWLLGSREVRVFCKFIILNLWLILDSVFLLQSRSILV